MEIEVLGPFRMNVGRISIVPTAAKTRTLLAVLVLYSGRVLPVSVLLEELWGAHRPRSAVTTLQSYVSQLRKILARVLPRRDPKLLLRTERGGYLMDSSLGRLDASEFERLAAAGLQSFAEHDYRAAGAWFREALALWQGPMLGGVPVGPCLSTEVARLERSRLTVLRHRIECDLRCGRHQQAAAELAELIGRHPGCETFQRQLTVARRGPVRPGHPEDPACGPARPGRDPRLLRRVAR